MAINPYAGNDPRWWEWEQRERLQSQLEEQNRKQAEAAQRAEEIAIKTLVNQTIQMDQQTQYLRQLSEPQRQRQAILDAAKKEKEDKERQLREAAEKKLQELGIQWMNEAPPNVRESSTLATHLGEAIKELQEVRSAPASFIDVVCILSLIASVCLGAAGLLIGFAALSVGESVGGLILAVTIGVAVLLFMPFSINHGKRTKTDRSLAQEQQQYRTKMEHHQKVVNDYLSMRMHDFQARKKVKAHITLPQPESQECPFCRETIKIGAKKCKHCGELL